MTDAPEGQTRIPLANLDWEKLGRAVAMLVPTSVYLRHASLDSTLRHYIHPEPLSETDFLRDLFTEPLEDVIAKWYGSRENAGRVAAAVMDEVLDGLIPGGMPGYLEAAKAATDKREP